MLLSIPVPASKLTSDGLNLTFNIESEINFFKFYFQKIDGF